MEGKQITRFRLILASLPVWCLVIWMGYGVVSGLLSDEKKIVAPRHALSRPVVNAIIIVVSVVVVVGYLRAKRWLRVKPGPRNKDLFEILRLPFARFPQQVGVAVRVITPGQPTPVYVSDPELQALVQQLVWPRLSEDLFICRKCGSRKSEFVATVENDVVAEIACADCAVGPPMS